MHLSYWCHNCITKKRQKVHKVPFQHDKRKMHKKALSIILFSSAPSCWFSKIKLPLLELKSVIIILKKSFFFTFSEICTFCLILNYNFDIELRTISKRIGRSQLKANIFSHQEDLNFLKVFFRILGWTINERICIASFLTFYTPFQKVLHIPHLPIIFNTHI